MSPWDWQLVPHVVLGFWGWSQGGQSSHTVTRCHKKSQSNLPPASRGTQGEQEGQGMVPGPAAASQTSSKEQGVLWGHTPSCRRLRRWSWSVPKLGTSASLQAQGAKLGKGLGEPQHHGRKQFPEQRSSVPPAIVEDCDHLQQLPASEGWGMQALNHHPASASTREESEELQLAQHQHLTS